MSRPLRFRIWANPEGHYIDAMTPAFGYAMAAYMTGAMDNRERRDEFERDLTFEQFTGLIDSKGHEIWEGDVVRAEIYGYPHWGAVEYVGCGFQANDKVRRAEAGNSVWIPLDTYYPVEVIGNVHEHPHLLAP